MKVIILTKKCPLSIYDTIERMLIEEEGLYLKQYKCSKGFSTIGVGRAETKGLSSEERNILKVNSFYDLKTITKKNAMMLLENDINYFYNELCKEFYYFEHSEKFIKILMLDLAFNIGINGLKKFKQMLKYCKPENVDYCEIWLNLTDSKHFQDVKGRNIRLGVYVLTGEILDLEYCRKFYAVLEKRINK